MFNRKQESIGKQKTKQFYMFSAKWLFMLAQIAMELYPNKLFFTPLTIKNTTEFVLSDNVNVKLMSIDGKEQEFVFSASVEPNRQVYVYDKTGICCNNYLIKLSHNHPKVWQLLFQEYLESFSTDSTASNEQVNRNNAKVQQILLLKYYRKKKC